MALFRTATAIDGDTVYSYLPARCVGCHGAMHQKQLWCYTILKQHLHPTIALDLAQALPVDSWLTAEYVEKLYHELTTAGATIDVVMAAMQHLSTITLPWARDMPLDAFKQGQRDGLNHVIIRYLATRQPVLRDRLNSVVGDPQLYQMTGAMLFKYAVETISAPLLESADVITRSDAAMLVNGIPLDLQSDMRQQYLNQPEIRTAVESLGDYNTIITRYTPEEHDAAVKWCYEHLNAPRHELLLQWAAGMQLDLSQLVPHYAITDHWDEAVAAAAAAKYIPVVVAAYRDSQWQYSQSRPKTHKATWICQQLNWPYKPVGIWRNAGSCCRRHIICPNYSDYRVDASATLSFSGNHGKPLPNATIITPLSTQVADMRVIYVAYNH